MKEEAWLVCSDPEAMAMSLKKKRGNRSRRKLRLFALSACRQMWDSLDSPCRELIELAERCADGEIEESVVHAAWLSHNDAYHALQPNIPTHGAGIVAGYRATLYATTDMVPNQSFQKGGSPWSAKTAWMFARRAVGEVVELKTGSIDSALRAELEVNAHFSSCLRCIFPNPFRRIAADPAWLTPTARSIADAIYRKRAFDLLPILADALEEAGCSIADILLHCRTLGEHARGCWVVDLVLRKE